MTDFEKFLTDIKFETISTDSKEVLEDKLNKLYSYCEKQHGKVEGNYMNEAYKKNNSISKGREGLDVHHKMEYDPNDPDICSLSNPENAKVYPYEYQLAENLVYCNWIEHQAAHAIIDILRKQQSGVYRLGCIDRRAPMLNRFFDDGGEEYFEALKKKEHTSYLVKSLDVIKDELDAYVLIMDAWAEGVGVDSWQLLGQADSSAENVFEYLEE